MEEKIDGEYEQSSGTNNHDDSFLIMTAIVTILIALLLISISLVYLFPGIGNISSAGPSGALITWENEYREITGLNEIQNLDGTGVILCIVDSGIDMNHPGFEGIEIAGWNDFVNQQPNPYDDEGHGTAMAGIIISNNGLMGNARGVSLLVAKAITEEGTGSDQMISESVDWCVENNADIISLSLGGAQGYSLLMH
jgi:subtilisin family serine protease